ncbi:MAG: Neutral/alkaline non-lysosomal ceramidase, C-terminal, partial [Myxococcaceae bacterium]|nr:Neutral/alkaline non-lysosomal ceramidase, C-terminal [Myxococcaceae bacterium]
YRIKHMGSWKNGTGGAITRYEGVSREFQVR